MYLNEQKTAENLSQMIFMNLKFNYNYISFYHCDTYTYLFIFMIIMYRRIKYAKKIGIGLTVGLHQKFVIFFI